MQGAVRTIRAQDRRKDIGRIKNFPDLGAQPGLKARTLQEMPETVKTFAPHKSHRTWGNPQTLRHLLVRQRRVLIKQEPYEFPALRGSVTQRFPESFLSASAHQKTLRR